ncbi:MAG: efflux RND transporter periplasmic adaptor subunit [Alphaproteobacteria bacterium]|nr:efflux RND transporter periplasmic adaptor subunit [Alphaproteobacteria bacterium]
MDTFAKKPLWVAGGAIVLVAAGMAAGYWLHTSGVQSPPGRQSAVAALNPASAASATGKILYYKNPMGLPDTSPVPKKDSMGMDYIPVYASSAGNEPGIVTVSPARVQMLGVKTAPVESRSALARKIEATGTIKPDESRLASVTTKFDGVVEKLLVATTGASVRAGQPLAQVWIQTPDTMMQTGPDVITRQIDLVIALQDKNSKEIAQAENVLRQYGIPESTIEEIKRTGRATRFVTITAPRSGVILEKPAIEGMHFNTGDPLFKIADLSTVWLMADVQEQDLGALRVGDSATASLVAYPGQNFTGKVDFIYPTLLAGTRQGQVRIVLPNPDGRLRDAMYARVTIDTPELSQKPMAVVPDSAILNNGSRQVVLVAHGQGRYEPRVVRIGAHGDGYTQILGGVKPGEQVVIGANFLIDAESNLQAALQSFASGGTASPSPQPAGPKP